MDAEKEARTRQELLTWVAFAIVLAVGAAIRWRLLDVPLERDEGGYAYFAQRWLQGEPPFAAAYTMHLPGTAAAYALAILAFGDDARGVRLGLLVAVSVTSLFLGLLERRRSGPAGALVAAAAHTSLSLSPALLGPFGHANHFVTLFGVTGLWALERALATRRLPWLASAGLLLGLAPVMKQSGAVFPAFAVAWLVVSRLRLGERAGLGREVAVLSAASACGMAVTFAALWLGGLLPTAWHWAFEYASAYASMQTPAAGLRVLATRLVSLGPAAGGLAALAVAGLLSGRDRSPRPSPVSGDAFALLLLAFVAAGASAGWYFRHHYFIPLVVPLALLAGSAVQRGVANGGRPAVAWGVAALLACAAPVATSADVLLRLPAVAVARRIYGANPFPEAVEVARRVAEATAPGERVAVVGSEPEILFLARRVSATGILYLYPLAEPSPHAPEMQEQLVREIQASDPAAVVWVDVPSSWAARVGAVRPVVEWVWQFLSEGYDLAGRVDIVGPERTDYRWGAEAAEAGVDGAEVLLFVRRRR